MEHAPRWHPEELAAGDIRALAPLFLRVWPGRDHAPTIEWAFSRPPQGRGIVLAALRDDGTAIGARGSIPWPLDERGAAIHQFHGTCVDPDHRRLGIFSALNRGFLERFGASGGLAVFNVSVAESRAGYEKLGWKYIGGLRRHVLVANPFRVAWQVALAGYRAVRHGPAVPLATSASIPSYAGLRAFLEERQRVTAALLTSRYDPAWYGWRFSRRDGGYRFAITGAGAAVYVMQQRAGLKEILLGDVWPRRYRTLDVARVLVSMLRAERPAIVSIVLSHSHPLRPILSRLGFIPDPKGDLNHGVRIVDARANDLLTPERWALATADIDTF